MKKHFFFIALALVFCQAGFSQELSKDEKKRLKEELKNYGKDLAGYKAKMEDIRATLDSNEAEIKRLKDDQAYASTKQAELENKIAGLETDLKKSEQESALLRGENVPDADPKLRPRHKQRLRTRLKRERFIKCKLVCIKTLASISISMPRAL
jgi:chromosome segregation ATPase